MGPARKTLRIAQFGLMAAGLCWGCPGGKETPDTGEPLPCVPGEGVLHISMVVEDDFSRSLVEYFDDDMFVMVFHKDEEPEGDCTEATQYGYDSIDNFNVGLEAELRVRVPTGWTCATAWGFTGHGVDTGYLGYCSGQIVPTDMGECDRLTRTLTSTCSLEATEGD